MDWILTMIVVHVALCFFALLLLPSTPDRLQWSGVALVALAFALYAASAICELAGAMSFSGHVKSAGSAFEHLGLIVMIGRLAFKERVCRLTLFRSSPSL